jgi:hypothetical protein
MPTRVNVYLFICLFSTESGNSFIMNDAMNIGFARLTRETLSGSFLLADL